MTEKTKQNYEFVLDGKTLITKDMSFDLRVLALENFVNKVSRLALDSETTKDKNEKIALNMELITANFKFVPKILWEFLQDKDKQLFAGIDGFKEKLNVNVSVLHKFSVWLQSTAVSQNDFLQNKPLKATKPKA